MKKLIISLSAICICFACNQPNINPLVIPPNDTIPHDTVPKDTIIIVPHDTVYEPPANRISDVETDYSPLNPSGLPTLRINTSGQAISSRSTWIENGVTYELFDATGSLIISGETDIKGRGNSTWDFPKKPYSLKLKTKQSILGMPAHKRWALLANYADKTLLRTEIGLKLGYIFNNLAWTPHAQQVNFYLNDEYRGVYQISESVKIDLNRVNIPKISTSNHNGGFLVECDWRANEGGGEEFWFKSPREWIFYNCSDPDAELDAVISATNKTIFQTIQEKIQSVENMVYTNNSLSVKQDYIDVNSFIDYYFVQEIVKNVDSKFALSVFLYYNPQTEKIHLGPLWDFDLCCGNVDYCDARYSTGFWLKDAPYYKKLFNSDTFKNLLKERWVEKKADVFALIDFIDQRAAEMEKAQRQNYKKWTIQDKYIWPNGWIESNYTDEIAHTKSWLWERLNWLDEQINAL
ncbi:MAG: CotH kinase family protein [Prevotellaceae bacterium]|jgi:hypothetical protein|nr:CotH kinase family protein [Prevotellaceae bacterium]